MKIVIQIELQKGKVETFDDVVLALQTTAGSLSDSNEPLSIMDRDAYVFTNQGEDVGVFTVTLDPLNDFTNQLD